jgi:hypothetical protein
MDKQNTIYPKISHTHTIEFYLAIKRNKVLQCDMTWVNLKKVKETSHKGTSVIDSIYIKCPEQAKKTETEGKLMIIRGREKNDY